MQNSPSITVEGLPSEHLNKASEQLRINHARFRITNNTGKDLSCEITRLTHRSTMEEQTIDTFYVYVLPDYTEVQHGNFTLPADQAWDIECSFAGIETGASDAGHEVVLQLQSGKGVYSAGSEVVFVTRFPRQ